MPPSGARAYLRRICDQILHAQNPLKVLKALNWDPQVHVRFFKRGARELPDPAYRPLGFDPEDSIRELRAIKRQIRGRNALEGALRRKCDEFIDVARLLSARGTKRFFHYSVRLYGEPQRAFRDSGVDNLQIARMWASRPLRTGAEPRTLGAAEALKVIGDLVTPVLGSSVRLRVSKRLTADAAAGATSIAVRQDARFSRRQARALAYHEGLWHVLTSLNGLHQPVLPVLGVGLSRFATAQEGGGVVSEFLSGTLNSERLRELGERALAVDMCARGADYLEVYRYLAHRFPEQKAAQLCERVFRGGVLEGGAPFTKDAVYQRGYCRVFNFIRHTVENGELDLLRAFFCGKMSLEDAPLVAALIEEGLVVPPRFLPPWAQDLDVLGAEVTHSLTMSRFDLGKVSRYYDRLAQRHEGSLSIWDAELTRLAEDAHSGDGEPHSPARRVTPKKSPKRPA